MKISSFLALILLTSTMVFADHPQLTQGPVKVSFVFPDQSVKQITLTYKESSKTLIEKPLPKDIPVEFYKIDWWVYAALQKLDLIFKVQTINMRTSIVKIGNFENDDGRRWIYFVNGTRSPYYINTQLDDDVKTIKFVFQDTSEQHSPNEKKRPHP